MEVEEMVRILEEIARMEGDSYASAKITAIRTLREIYADEEGEPPSSFEQLDQWVRRKGRGGRG
jgi:hypothetical protein